ncbi:hypothetical protein V1281_006183 [Nitrobacteraceae bacterium AZCC 2161]
MKMGRPKTPLHLKHAKRQAAKKAAAAFNKSKKPQYVHAFSTPSGRVYVRYEPPHGRKVIIRSQVGTPEFLRELADAKEGLAPRSRLSACPALTGSTPHTWRWLCEEYFESKEFKKYTKRDQGVRRRVLERTCRETLMPNQAEGAPTFGEMPMTRLETKAIITLRDRAAKYNLLPDPMYPDDRNKDREVPSTPEAANSVVRYARRVMAFAVEKHTELVRGRNWAAEVRFLEGNRYGHRTWGPEQCAIFESAYPRGTKARLIYDLARLTAQRLSDLARLGPAMLGRSPKGVERLKFIQAKGRSGNPVTAYVPISPEIRQALSDAKEAGILGEGTWIAQVNGKPYSTDKSIGNDFTDYCKAVDLVGYPLHGLRKTAVVDMIMADFSFFEIMAISGHRSKREIERYGREFTREKAMERAFKKWLQRHSHEDDFDERRIEAA